MKEVVLDTETTGISVKEGHRIVEIGCIELENLIPTKNTFHCYLNPERKVSEKALEVHGYTDEFLSKQKKFDEIGEEFLSFIKDKRIIIHNAEFDLGHLNNELSIFGKKKIDNEIVDTLILARDKFPGSPVSLDALCKRYKIDNSKRTQHTALIDCDLLAKVYINLIDQKEPTLNLQNQDEENAAVESLLGQLLESVKAIDQRREQSLLEMQQVAIELAIAAASHLVETVIEEDRFGIEDLIQSTFEQAGSDRSLRFSLHPDDLELLQRRISVTKSYQELRRLEFIEDFQLPRGSFQIHLPDGQTWLTGISLRLAEIRKHWLEELDAAQVERRQTETTNSSLRRFPDRRETA